MKPFKFFSKNSLEHTFIQTSVNPNFFESIRFDGTVQVGMRGEPLRWVDFDIWGMTIRVRYRLNTEIIQARLLNILSEFLYEPLTDETKYRIFYSIRDEFGEGCELISLN